MATDRRLQMLLFLATTLVVVTVVSGRFDDWYECSDIKRINHGNNADYYLYLGPRRTRVHVYCDMKTSGGGWTVCRGALSDIGIGVARGGDAGSRLSCQSKTMREDARRRRRQREMCTCKYEVIQRRMNGYQDFFLGWKEYKNGFGDVYEEFWIGNDNLHLLTSGSGMRHRLRIDMTDWQGHKAFAEYDNFKIASEKEKYKLISLGKFTGNAGDSLSYHTNQMFTTKDQDNDKYNMYSNRQYEKMGGKLKHRSCATELHGAWWFHSCLSSDLNGVRMGPKAAATSTYPDTAGIVWSSWKGRHYSLKSVEMKIRPY